MFIDKRQHEGTARRQISAKEEEMSHQKSNMLTPDLELQSSRTVRKYISGFFGSL